MDEEGIRVKITEHGTYSTCDPPSQSRPERLAASFSIVRCPPIFGRGGGSTACLLAKAGNGLRAKASMHAPLKHILLGITY